MASAGEAGVERMKEELLAAMAWISGVTASRKDMEVASSGMGMETLISARCYLGGCSSIERHAARRVDGHV